VEKKAVIIPAAGTGTRMGSDIPKPFLKLFGKSILQRSIQCFLQIDGLMQVLIATSEEYFEECKSIFDDISHEEIQFNVVKGGNERQDSIWNAIQHLTTEIDLVAIHDAVRPFVKKVHIDNCFDAASEFGGAVLCVPAKDTIKKVNSENFITETPDRSQLWQAQTPQVFRKKIIAEAYESAIKENFLGTDDASLVERYGGTVKVVEGSRENLKITFPIDLKIAEFIIKEGL